MAQTPYNYLDPVALSRLGNMELVARLVVEGFITGLHKSPYQGFSIEFSEHRQYMPGDEVKHIDWKVPEPLIKHQTGIHALRHHKKPLFSKSYVPKTKVAITFSKTVQNKKFER